MKALSGWGSDATGQRRHRGLYETTLATSLFEYMIVLFFGAWLIVEYLHNVYQQQYFGSFNPVFLVTVLMASSAYGFVKLVYSVRRIVGLSNTGKPEDDD